jgi:hypothetical protein
MLKLACRLFCPVILLRLQYLPCYLSFSFHPTILSRNCSPTYYSYPAVVNLHRLPSNPSLPHSILPTKPSLPHSHPSYQTIPTKWPSFLSIHPNQIAIILTIFISSNSHVIPTQQILRAYQSSYATIL